MIKMKDCELWLGDCLQLMGDISDESVDMILCDPPYGVLNRQNPKAKWDSQIDLATMWSHYIRVIKPNGAILLFGSGMFTADIMKSNSKMWRYNLVWDKVATTGFLNANRMPLRRHEDIMVFYKKLPTYNPQMQKCKPHKRNHMRGNMQKPIKNSCYGSFINVPTVITDEKYPTSIIRISKEHCNGKFYHPTQKPVELLEWLIKSYTNEGDLVLDNCMGSGSTGVACANTGRKFLGIEIESKYFEIAKSRIFKE